MGSIPKFIMRTFLFRIVMILLSVQDVFCQCEPGISINTTHSWNKGYIAKLILDQAWLAQYTSDWKLTIIFCNRVQEFKVWSADIVSPPTNTNYVNNVLSVDITNKCWNSILYTCQNMEVVFLVRYPEAVEDEFSNDYNIVTVTETVTYKDGSTGITTYCPVMKGDMLCMANETTPWTSILSSTPTPTTTTSTTTTSTSTTTTTTTTTFFQNARLKIVVRDSQQNDPVRGVFANISLEQQQVAENAEFSSKGIYFQTVDSNGVYDVTLSADGFINKTFTVEVNCTMSNCVMEKRVILSPVLQPGQTRLILSWETSQPEDLDLYVVGVKKSDNSICKIWYDDIQGCPSSIQDRDNAAGGLNGPETVTLEDSAINSQYTYMIAVEDFNFPDNGAELLTSGASITLTNELDTVEHRMTGNTMALPEDYYLFGCVDVQNNGEFIFTPAPNGTFFNGEEDSEWVSLYNNIC